MTQRPLTRPGVRMLNHVELVYPPGERRLARLLLECLGFRVVDPQKDPVPEELGPAAGPYLIVFLDREDESVFDNVIYASEVREEQWRFESAIRDRLKKDEKLAELHEGLRDAFANIPQAMTHFGVAFPSADEVEQAMKRIAATPELEGRVSLSKLYVPGGEGSADDRVAQGFVYTDVISAGLLCGGQQIELQVRLDGG
ncbi:MAG: hypothetical protein JRG86_08770 [Deltaproteobacteria bacterium]|nr:hypothetical protein [Deltaproteobacteria bacterium]MBW2497175.1 hypothetical protein [Deltaproteobacteria bacterium]